ncbi:ABC transporter permease [Dyella mobilis]|uniref:ABC transporter permease n=1 Tax=Dyella mobilis TaxID=1849582 RepID=A0ABS2KIW7_9GAMM|nr:ABC transporter permease [Dyella mobilis]MBM7131100.1 ABC transporter permease [Dyella mobilis]UDM84282.1 transporter [Dyella mobilis]GLQ98973.1 ABC transporter ATP-binding protein [Dyella mobilis]
MFGYYVQLAFQSLRRNRVLTALMILAIAVGIGASMTTLTVMRILSGDPLPGRSAQIFYPQVDANPDVTSHGPYDLLDYRSAMDLWSAHRADRQALVAAGDVHLVAPHTDVPALKLSMLTTTADFFSMFNVPFQYGQPWGDAEDASRARVAVISDDLNNKLFAGANSVGRTIRLHDNDVRIIGVLKPWRPSPLFYDVGGGRFADGDTGDFYSKPQDVMVPFSTGQDINRNHFDIFTCYRLYDGKSNEQTSPCVWVRLWVQLGDASKVTAYRRFVADYAAQQKALGRIGRADDTRMMNLMQWLDFNHVVPGDVRLETWLALAFLIICLFNTVGLLLAKFLQRGPEIGVRRALGASRAAVFAQCLVESSVVGLLGGFGGWLLTLLGLWIVRRQPTAYADLVHLDLAMFLATLALSMAATLCAGILPAFRASRVTPALQLKTT